MAASGHILFTIVFDALGFPYMVKKGIRHLQVYV